MSEKFGQKRYRLEGQEDWVTTSHAVSVAGVHHRLQEAHDFARAVDRCERQGLKYLARAIPEPTNPKDPKAIGVGGICEKRSLFGKVTAEWWHIGYLDADLAHELHADLIVTGLGLGLELYSIYRNERFIDIKVIALAPRGHSMRVRERSHIPLLR